MVVNRSGFEVTLDTLDTLDTLSKHNYVLKHLTDSMKGFHDIPMIIQTYLNHFIC